MTGLGIFMCIVGGLGYVLFMCAFIKSFSTEEESGVTNNKSEQLNREFQERSLALSKLLDCAPTVKDTLKNKKRDDHFVKCIDMGPVATDPIPDEIWKNIKEEEI